nr:olfactory receptor 51E1-like [Pelodiscus sinensis]|eukprot:XP_006131147.2 olfactory receptor 51E1-like [Pelodiscus sinensis]
MSYFNTTSFTNPPTFILQGIPGLEAAHVWISIPFCVMYALALVGNITILFVVKMEPSLHEACLTQMYFIHWFAAIESGILAAMALDRYWHSRTNIIPEPYCSHIAVVKLACGDSSVSSYYGLFVMLCVVGLDVISIAISYMLILRAIFILPTKDARLKTFLTCGTHLCAIVIFYIPSVIYSLMSRFGKNFPLHVHVLLGNMHFLLPPMLNPIIYGWPYCRTNIIPEPYCVHIAVVKLACADTRVNSYYGLFVLFGVVGLDMIFIALSYLQILRAIFNLPTKDARLKTFLTCGSHLCAIGIFYIPSVIYSLIYRFGQNFPQHVHVLFGNMHFLLPPMLNPIIYGVKTKQIRARLLGLVTRK